MKTTIKITAPDDSNKNEIEMTFSDEGYAVLGFMDIIVDGKEIGSVHIDNIMSALIAFDCKKNREQEYEKEN